MPHLDFDPELLLDEPKSAPAWSSRVALGWCLATGLCASGLWAGFLLIANAFWGVHITAAGLRGLSPIYAILTGASLALCGVIVGALVGFVSGGTSRGAVVAFLSIGGGLFGAIGGSFSVIAGTFSQEVHPLVSTSLVWAIAGMLRGLSAYVFSRWVAKREATTDEEELPTRSIQWLLREQKRRWYTRALIHVLPVLITSVGSLVVAAIYAPSELSIAFLAVGVLGLSIALVLHNQHTRLRTIEQRFQQKRDSEPHM